MTVLCSRHPQRLVEVRIIAHHQDKKTMMMMNKMGHTVISLHLAKVGVEVFEGEEMKNRVPQHLGDCSKLRPL